MDNTEKFLSACLLGLAWMAIPCLWLDQEHSTVQKEFPNAELNLITYTDGERYIYCITDYIIKEGELKTENRVVVMKYERHWFYYFFVGKYEIEELEHNCSDCGEATTTCLT